MDLGIVGICLFWFGVIVGMPPAVALHMQKHTGAMPARERVVARAWAELGLGLATAGIAAMTIAAVFK